MAKKTPYRILQVDPAATEQEIIKAYRKMSKKLHPDMGGDSDKFAELNEAYRIVGNTALRKRYDETGEWETPEPDNVHAGAVSEIADMFGQLMQQFLAEQVDPEKKDIARLLVSKLRNKTLEKEDEVEKIKKGIDKAQKMRKRFKSTNDKPPVMHIVLDDQISEMKKMMLTAEKALAILAYASDLCQVQEFDFEIQEDPFRRNSFTYSTGGF